MTVGQAGFQAASGGLPRWGGAVCRGGLLGRRCSADCDHLIVAPADQSPTRLNLQERVPAAPKPRAPACHPIGVWPRLCRTATVTSTTSLSARWQEEAAVERALRDGLKRGRAKLALKPGSPRQMRGRLSATSPPPPRPPSANSRGSTAGSSSSTTRETPARSASSGPPLPPAASWSPRATPAGAASPAVSLNSPRSRPASASPAASSPPPPAWTTNWR